MISFFFDKMNYMPAIFVGRFQPFHKGHLAAIKWILRKEKKILIFLGSTQEPLSKKNPFSFRERKKMIKKTLAWQKINNFKIYGIENFASDKLWVKRILERAKLKSETVVVFTNNRWTKKCFLAVGTKVKPHPVFEGGISATKIRTKIAKGEKWDNFVPRTTLQFLKEIKGEPRIKDLFFKKNKIHAD